MPIPVDTWKLKLFYGVLKQQILYGYCLALAENWVLKLMQTFIASLTAFNRYSLTINLKGKINISILINMERLWCAAVL